MCKPGNYNIYLNASSKFWSWDIGKNSHGFYG